MRIAYLITRMDSIGGAQIHVRDLSLWLKQNGHDPVVLTGAAGPICETLAAAGIDVLEICALVRPIRLLKDARALGEIRRTLKSCAPDLVSCHSSKAGILGRIAARTLGLPVIFTAHGWSFTEGVPLAQRYAYRAVERLCGRLSDHIITVCQYDRELALVARIAPADRITTVHNGMPFLPPVQRTASATGPVQIGMVARFDQQKDHETLIAALGRLPHKNWRLQLIGGGDSSKVMNMAAELNLLDRVECLGQQSNIPELLAKMDVFCLISKWEGFPRSILESMRSSLPVVASDVAGVREAVEDGVTGYLVPVGNDRLLAKSLEHLIDSPTVRVAMGNRARVKYENRFTLDHLLKPTLHLYESILIGAREKSGALAPGESVGRSLQRQRS